MPIQAKIIADSISEAGKRLTTLQLVYPRFIHSELMTHRVFSRNASSSRAIPVKKMLEMVINEPAMPIHWGKNQPGMQAKAELEQPHKIRVQALWREAAHAAAAIAEKMEAEGAHKQIVNRILEPFQHISVVLTATEFDNWFELRAHEDAQPEIHELALQMRLAMGESVPHLLKPGEWHLPYITGADMTAIQANVGASFNTSAALTLAAKVSAARCCRVSYLTHDGRKSSIEEDLALCDRLAGARPIHASPFEHQATPDYMEENQFDASINDWSNKHLHGNLVGWVQHRKLLEAKMRHSA